MCVHTNQEELLTVFQDDLIANRCVNVWLFGPLCCGPNTNPDLSLLMFIFLALIVFGVARSIFMLLTEPLPFLTNTHTAEFHDCAIL